MSTQDSLETAFDKISNFLRKIKKELKSESNGIFSLKEAVLETKAIIKKVNKMDEVGLQDLADDLYMTKKWLCRQIDKEERRMEDRKSLPKPVLASFNTDKMDTYLDFKFSIMPCLIYDKEHLNVSTLLSAIKGQKKMKVLNCVKHKTNTRAIWKVWDSKFGSIDISQSDLLRKLKTMTTQPRTDLEESENIEKILEYCDLAMRHQRRKEFINITFIWEMTNYLKYHHKSNVMEKKIFKAKKFMKYLKKINESNDLTMRTRKVEEKKKSDGYGSRGLDRGSRGGHGGTGYGASRGTPPGTRGHGSNKNDGDGREPSIS